MRRDWDNLSVPMMMTLEFVVQVYTQYFVFTSFVPMLFFKCLRCTCGVIYTVATCVRSLFVIFPKNK